jgi:hypothetical protein
MDTLTYCGASTTMQIAVSTGDTTLTRLGSQPAVRWSAVIAGWLIAAGIAYLFYLAGLAIGFTAFDAANAAQVEAGIGVGSALWMILTWVVSLFLGGMFASWFDRSGDQTVGTLHGVAVWGLAVTATAALMAFGATQALPTGAPLLEQLETRLSEEARDYSAAGLWVLFASTFLALFAAAVGGWVGAGHESHLFDRSAEQEAITRDSQAEYTEGYAPPR